MRHSERVVKIATVSFFPLLIVTLALVSYRLTVVAIIATALLVLVYTILAVVGSLGGLMGKTSWGCSIVWLAMGVVLFVVLFTTILPNLKVKPHQVVIDPATSIPGLVKIERYEQTLARMPQKGFAVEDRILVLTRQGQDTVRLHSRMVQSSSVGLFVKKVAIDLRCDSESQREISRDTSQVALDQAPCPDTVRVRVLAMPVDMFYQAQGGSSLAKTQFVNTESIEWSVSKDEQPIVFAYLAPPAHLVKPFIPDFVWAHSGGRLAILAITAIVLPILMGVGVDVVKRLVDKK